MEAFFNASKGKICFKIKTPRSRGSTLFFTHKGNNAQVLARLGAPCGQEGPFPTHRVSHAGQSLDLGNIQGFGQGDLSSSLALWKMIYPRARGAVGEA